jgi:Protein kinase domain
MARTTEPTEPLRDGRFVVVGTLGEGSQGRTFDGVDKREGQPVAIKRFDVRGAGSWKDVDLAEREARVLQSLSHPRLPRYVDRFEHDGALYLVMEKIEGESLAVLRKRGATLDEAAVVRLLKDASQVLDYLHGRKPPVIHRDLKPGNVLRRPDGSFAFVDFGAVRDKLRPEGGSTIVGTFGYMAPEQFQGRALPGSDVYAIGATAVAMLTGREPEELPHRGLALDVRAALKGHASGALVDVLEKMLDPDPDRRASRIGPLLERLTTRGSRPARDVRTDAHEHVDRFARKQVRRAARRAERAARRARRGHHRPPFPVSLVVTLSFLVATLAVSLATQVVVPMVLMVLSLFFARRGLTAAAAAVRDAGHRAVDAMGRARQGMDDAPRQPLQARIAGEDRQRLRVELPTEHAEHGEGLVEDADEDEAAGAKHRRR